MKNKILKISIMRSVMICLIISDMHNMKAQNLPTSTYGLPFINSISLYQKSLLNHPEKQMIPLSRIPEIILDLRYATKNNFMGKNMYPENTKETYLRRPVFMALDSVAMDFARKGICLIIYDAYRPYFVTEAFWDSIKDEHYAANPAKGSGHNRGISVDLGLADIDTHRPLPMPTTFDNFTDTAHQDFSGIDATRILNRKLLKQVMEKYGFIPLSTEWWHFSWNDAADFEILDLNFQQLSTLK